MEPPTIGCVPYLNAKPLIAWFHTPEGAEAARVIYDVPSKLATMLERKEIVAGMLSSFEAFRRPEARIVPGIAIADQGRVVSVRLFSKVPFEQIRSLALDQSSLTSNALVRILLAELYGVRPVARPEPPNLSRMIAEYDAGMLIGDPGMGAVGQGLQTLDLGEAWHRLTKLPFVWAVWLANNVIGLPELSHTLTTAKQYGLARIPQIAAAEAKRLGWPEARCLEYLRDVMDYELGARHVEGLTTFQKLCVQHGLIDRPISLRFA